MSTLYQMVERVSANLHGFGGANQEQIGVLLSAISASDNSFNIGGSQLSNGTAFRAGVWEIGTELIYVSNLTPAGQATGVIRGFNGTTPAAHIQNSVITNNPKFPRARIIEYINDIISGLYPSLSVFKSYEFRANARAVYELPGDCLEVFRVSTSIPGYGQGWYANKYWSYDASAGSLSGTNRALMIEDNMVGRTTRVVYKAEPRKLVLGDSFSASGYEAHIEAVVIAGATWLLAGGLDSRTLTGNSEALQSDRGALNNAGTTNAKYYAQVYQTQLAVAIARQAQQYPLRLHYGTR